MTPEQLKEAMGALPEPPSDSRPPFWDYWRHDLWTRAQTEEDPRNFEKWPCIYHTMLVNHWHDYIQKQYAKIRDMPRLVSETHLPPYPSDRLDNTPHSMNLIHQAHHLWTFFKTVGLQMHKQKRIVEFGGGYGAMALLARRLCLAGSYHIIDLPEFALLQQFYLSQMGADGHVTWGDPPDRCDLLIANHSLSEIPIDKRDRWIIALRPRAVLFLYSSRFAGYDNVAYFQEHLPDKFDAYRFEHVSCDDVLPTGSWYTIGR